VGIGGMKMVIRGVGTPPDAETVAVFVGHPSADRRVIFHYMSVAIDYFVWFRTHVSAPFQRAVILRRAEESRSQKCRILR
jgi:hypothetical protein